MVRSLPEPLVERLLATWPVARLATTAADGRPHLVPVVFAWHEGALWSPIDAKPKAAGRVLARERNLARDPRAALLLDFYGADWTALWWIRVDGRGALCGAGAGVDVERAGGAAEALRAKYPQYRRVPLFADASAPRLVRLVPERITSWAASDRALDRLREA